MILGSGGAAFEIMRYLVDRLPVMLTPRWVHTPVQPIAIRNVLTYLIGLPGTRGGQGPDLRHRRPGSGDLPPTDGYLCRRGPPPPAPHHSGAGAHPRLSSYWIHLVTPVPASLAQPLAEGLANPVVCQDNRIRDLIPQELLDCRSTIRLALQRIEQQRVETCWSDAGRLSAAGMGPLRRRRLRRGHRPQSGLPGAAPGHPGGSLAAAHPDRRRHGLVLRRLPLEPSGAGSTASWGARAAAGPAPPHRTPGGRCPGFLPGAGNRAGPAPAAPGRNEAARGGHPGISPRPPARRRAPNSPRRPASCPGASWASPTGTPWTPSTSRSTRACSGPSPPPPANPSPPGRSGW